MSAPYAPGRVSLLDAAAIPADSVDDERQLDPAVKKRASELLSDHRRSLACQTDRLFARLLVFEWLVAVGMALVLSPAQTWLSLSAPAHPSPIATAALGGLVIALPLHLVWRRPGKSATRIAIAIAQMFIGSLLISITGGRPETHFHVFGSLAMLAFYRDWRVLLAGTLVVVADLLVHGTLAPMAVYGAPTGGFTRGLEHIAWIAFENVFLFSSCASGQREMKSIAKRHAQLEHRRQREQDAVHAALQATRAKSEFLANMSHEIRTPMTAITGYADLLLETNISSVDRVEYVQTIRRNGDHLLQVINDILDISKIEAGKVCVEALECSAISVIANVASLMRVQAREKGLAFDVRYDGAIPETIRTDPTRLRQIVMNLVGNAIKFTATGRVAITVRFENDANQGELVVEVHDTGLGLTKAQIEKLFEPFSQADTSTTRRFGGTGLGLAISKRLAVLLGGDISLESVHGVGSKFTLTVGNVTVPGAKMVVDVREAATAEAIEAPTSPVTLQSLRVLLAEDGPDNQRLLATLLRSAGATVEIAENGRVAMDQVLNAVAMAKPYDVVLMDMQMPEVDGYTATSKLRFGGYSGAIVALTAHAMTGDRERCLAIGCDGYLAKPVRREALVDTVKRYAATKNSAPPSGLRSTLSNDLDMRELIDEFVQSLPSRAAQLQAAIDRSDVTSAQRLAHQLKGAAGGYGFPAITDAAEVVELEILKGGATLTSAVEKLNHLVACTRA